MKPENAKRGMKWPLWATGLVSIAMAFVYAVVLEKEFFGGTCFGLGLATFAVDFGLRMKAREKKKAGAFKGAEAAVSPVIGVILMVAITVVLSAIVFVLVTELTTPQDSAPRLGFQANETVLMVINAPIGLDWADFTVEGCTTVPTGAVDAGDKILGCASVVVITHRPSNSVIYSR